MAQVALAWIMNREGTSGQQCTICVLTIFDGRCDGPHSWFHVLGELAGAHWYDGPILVLDHLFNLSQATVNVELTLEEIKYLEEPYEPRTIIGHV